MQAKIREGVFSSVSDRPCESARRRIECVDRTVSHIGNQAIVAEWPETRAWLGDSPRSVQHSAGGKPPQEISFKIEDAYNPVSWPNDRRARRISLQGIGHEDLLSNRLNPKWRIIRGKTGVCKSA